MLSYTKIAILCYNISGLVADEETFNVSLW